MERVELRTNPAQEAFVALFGINSMRGGPRWPLLSANLLAAAATW